MKSKTASKFNWKILKIIETWVGQAKIAFLFINFSQRIWMELENQVAVRSSYKQNMLKTQYRQSYTALRPLSDLQAMRIDTSDPKGLKGLEIYLNLHLLPISIKTYRPDISFIS